MKYFDFHRSSYAEKLPGILLSQVAINIFRVGSIIRVQFSGWQLFGGIYQQSIILWGNSLSANCPRANYLGDNFWKQLGSNCLENNYPGDNCLEDNYPGAIVLFPSNIFSIVISTNIPWDQSFGGVSSNIKLSAKKSKCVQTTGQFNAQISLVFSCTS